MKSIYKIDEAQRTSEGASKGAIKTNAFFLPVLKTINIVSTKTEFVLDEVIYKELHKVMDITPEDKLLQKNIERWKYRIAWVTNRLRNAKLIDKNNENYREWKITPAGTDFLKKYNLISSDNISDIDSKNALKETDDLVNKFKDNVDETSENVVELLTKIKENKLTIWRCASSGCWSDISDNNFISMSYMMTNKHSSIQDWKKHDSGGKNSIRAWTNRLKKGDFVIIIEKNYYYGIVQCLEDFNINPQSIYEFGGEKVFGRKVSFIHKLENGIKHNFKGVHNNPATFSKYHQYGFKPEVIFQFIEQLDPEIIDEFSNIIESEDDVIVSDSTENNDITAASCNKILYGPPGTGKTFKLKSEYFPKYTSKETNISKEKHLENIVSNCSWWQVIGVALLELGKSKVSDIYNHKWVKEKARISNSSSIRPTLWGQLQAHTVVECEFVNVKRRMEPSIFNKTKDSKWEIIKENLEEQTPELLDLIKSVNEFNPNPEKEIKRYKFVTFHQSYGYEDFIEGIKPIIDEETSSNGDIGYKIIPGVFKELCTQAKRDPSNQYAIFIDEINRGNVSSIFGELITLIELDKREGGENPISIILPYSKTEFSVPINVDIIGTMNTADRSVEALDTALRRRFTFEEMLPDTSVIEKNHISNGIISIGENEINLSKLLTTINNRIEVLVDRDHTIGHAYFMSVNNVSDLKNVLQNKIIPLLQEYFYGDYKKLEMVIGSEFFIKNEHKNIEFAISNNELDFDGTSYEFKDISRFTASELLSAINGIKIES